MFLVLLLILIWICVRKFHSLIPSWKLDSAVIDFSTFKSQCFPDNSTSIQILRSINDRYLRPVINLEFNSIIKTETWLEVRIKNTELQMPRPKDATIRSHRLVTCNNLTSFDENQECREKCVAFNTATGAHFEKFLWLQVANVTLLLMVVLFLASFSKHHFLKQWHHNVITSALAQHYRTLPKRKSRRRKDDWAGKRVGSRHATR